MSRFGILLAALWVFAGYSIATQDAPSSAGVFHVNRLLLERKLELQMHQVRYDMIKFQQQLDYASRGI